MGRPATNLLHLLQSMVRLAALPSWRRLDRHDLIIRQHVFNMRKESFVGHQLLHNYIHVNLIDIHVSYRQYTYMDIYRLMAQVLEKAEAELRELAKQAINHGAYAEVKVVTDLAKSVSDLRAPISSGATAMPLGVVETTAVTDESKKLQHAQTVAHRLQITEASTDYPRFERHDNKLVKLGWSSKDSRIYEQRVPLDAVEEICRRFLEKSSPKKLLRLEKILPLKFDNEDEIPSYQVYLVLKWLQSLSVVERKGKDGYEIAKDGLDLKALWRDTPSR